MIFFAQNLRYLRKQLGETQAQLGVRIGASAQTVSNWEKGVSKPDVVEVADIAKNLGISLDHLITIELEKGGSKAAITPEKNGSNYANNDQQGQITHMVEEPSGRESGRKLAGRGEKVVNFTPKVITVDNAGNDNILYVPIKARAGYLSGYGDPEYISSLTSFHLPTLRHGTFRMFEVSGPSMSPTINDRDAVIGSYVQSFDDVVDGRIYVVVTRSEGIVVKRLLNRISERGKVVLKSDTIAHRKEFPTKQIDPEDIIEMWYARIKFSADFSEPAEIYHRINELEADMVELKEITGLLKQKTALLEPEIKLTTHRSQRKASTNEG